MDNIGAIPDSCCMLSSRVINGFQLWGATLSVVGTMGKWKVAGNELCVLFAIHCFFYVLSYLILSYLIFCQYFCFICLVYSIRPCLSFLVSLIFWRHPWKIVTAVWFGVSVCYRYVHLLEYQYYQPLDLFLGKMTIVKHCPFPQPQFLYAFSGALQLDVCGYIVTHKFGHAWLELKNIYQNTLMNHWWPFAALLRPSLEVLPHRPTGPAQQSPCECFHHPTTSVRAICIYMRLVW